MKFWMVLSLWILFIGVNALGSDGRLLRIGRIVAVSPLLLVAVKWALPE
jgi:hypothetical protein